jgi:hypothetical protein
MNWQAVFDGMRLGPLWRWIGVKCEKYLRSNKEYQ